MKLLEKTNKTQMLIVTASVIATIAMAIDMNSPSDVDEEFNRIFDVK